MAGGLGGAGLVVASTPRSLRPAVILSLLWHLVLLGMIASVGYGFFHVDDPQHYDRVSVWMAEQWGQGTVPDISRQWRISSFGYYYWSAALYRVFGHHPFIPQLANLVFALTAGVLTFHLVRRLSGSEFAARVAAVGVLFYPTLAVWSVMMLKDILSGVLLLASLNLAFAAGDRPPWWRWMELALIGFIASTFRFYFGVVALGIGAVTPQLMHVRPRLHAFAASALLALTLVGSFGVGEGHWYLQAIEGRQGVAQLKEGLSGGGSSLDTSGSSLAWKLIRFFLVPLPSQRGSPLVEIGKLDWLFWWPLLILSLFGLKRAVMVSWQRTLIVVLPIASLVVFYAALIGNAGTLIRYRATLFPLFAVLGSLGLDELARISPARVRALWERFA